MAEKKEQNKFTIQFNAADPSHRQVADLLKMCIRDRRPLTPGSYPKSAFNQVTAIHNYDFKTYGEEIGREAWGYIEYKQPLHPENAIDFELTPPPGKIKKIRFIGIDSWRCMVFKDESGMLWKYAEPGDLPMKRCLLYTSFRKTRFILRIRALNVPMSHWKISLADRMS